MYYVVEMERKDELLEKAAASLTDFIDPFSTEWLAENNVTLDEVYNLSATIGHIIRGYLACDADQRSFLLMLGALAEEKNAKVVENFKVFYEKERISRKIRAL